MSSGDATVRLPGRPWVKGIALGHLAFLSVVTILFLPYTAGATLRIIPWNRNPLQVCVVMWFLESSVWLPLALIFSVFVTTYCFWPRRVGWIHWIGLSGLVALSVSMICSPYYIESVGLISLSDNGGVRYSHMDFQTRLVSAQLILLPIVLFIAAYRRARRKRSSKPSTCVDPQ